MKKNIVSKMLGTLFKPKRYFSIQTSDYKPKIKNKSFDIVNRMIGKTKVSIKKPLINKKYKLYKDSDRDGIIDIIDCRPYNKRKQDVTPNVMQMQRIKKMPIYLSRTEPTSKSRSYVHLSEAPKSELRQRVYSTFKKYPQLYGQIEKEKPALVVFTTKRKYLGKKKQLEQMGHTRSREGEGSAVVVRTPSIEYAKKKESKYGRYEMMSSARTTTHELKHVEQHKKIFEKPTYEGQKTEKKRWFGGRYAKQKGEIESKTEEAKLTRSRPDILKKQVEAYEVSGGRKTPKFKETKEYIEKEEQRVEKAKEEGFKQLTKDEQQEVD